jgi:hypothetical protein
MPTIDQHTGESSTHKLWVILIILTSRHGCTLKFGFSAKFATILTTHSTGKVNT